MAKLVFKLNILRPNREPCTLNSRNYQRYQGTRVTYEPGDADSRNEDPSELKTSPQQLLNNIPTVLYTLE